MIRNSIFHVYDIRKQQLNEDLKAIEKKKEELKKTKAQQNIGGAIGQQFVKKMIVKEEEQKMNVFANLMSGNLFDNLDKVVEYSKTKDMRRNLQDQM